MIIDLRQVYVGYDAALHLILQSGVSFDVPSVETKSIASMLNGE
jgi:hypothetical protein